MTVGKDMCSQFARAVQLAGAPAAGFDYRVTLDAQTASTCRISIAVSRGADLKSLKKLTAGARVTASANATQSALLDDCIEAVLQNMLSTQLAGR